MTRFRPALLTIALTAAVALSACGTTEDPAEQGSVAAGADATTPSAAASSDAASSDTGSSDEPSESAATADKSSAATESGNGSAGSGPIEITDGVGRAFTLDAPATRVVALEWGEAETLISLGVMPVGVADVEGYSTWDVSEPLDDSVTDVGTRSEPSVDAVLALKPDLVVMSGDTADKADMFADSVPVLVATSADTSRQLDRLRDDTRLLATATGTEDAAEQLLADLDTTLADGKAALAEAGHAGEPFLLADGWMEGSTVAIRMFARGSLLSDVTEELGLQNAWTNEGDKAWGLGQTDIEGLAGMTDENLRLFYSASEEDVFADGLSKNAIWTSLPFVQQQQLTKLTPGTWTFGGPSAVEFYVEQVLQAYGV